jgi:hypothetical protein
MAAPVLDWTADPPGVSAASHLRAFRILVLAHFAVQSWAWAVKPVPVPAPFPPLGIHLAAAVLSFLCVAAFFRRGRLACALALPIVAWEVYWVFPSTPNHTFLGFVVIGLCSFLDSDEPDEEALLLQALRWLAVLIFFWAGVQKLLHGLYFRGEFLLWMVGQGVERWGDLFGWLVPAEEVARLRSLPRFMTGAGPYRVDSLPMILAANSVWIGEIALAVGMLFRRTREFAAVGAIGLAYLVQLAPREFMFALLYTNLLLLFVRGDWNRRLLPLFLALYAGLLAVLLGAPAGFLLKASGTL